MHSTLLYAVIEDFYSPVCSCVTVMTVDKDRMMSELPCRLALSRHSALVGLASAVGWRSKRFAARLWTSPNGTAEGMAGCTFLASHQLVAVAVTAYVWRSD
jgi:hypothetical protein